MIATRNNWQIEKSRAGICGTWVNALIIRVMNAGCDKHLIALVQWTCNVQDNI